MSHWGLTHALNPDQSMFWKCPNVKKSISNLGHVIPAGHVVGYCMTPRLDVYTELKSFVSPIKQTSIGRRLNSDVFLAYI